MSTIAKRARQIDREQTNLDATDSMSHTTGRRARVKDKITLLREAVALEEAGSTWTQPHVAALCNRSVSYIRNSDCPKSYEEGHGPKGKPLLVYEPAKVRAWMAARIRAIVAATRRT